MNNLFQYTPIGNNLGLGNTRNYVPMSQFTQQQQQQQPIRHQHSHMKQHQHSHMKQHQHQHQHSHSHMRQHQHQHSHSHMRQHQHQHSHSHMRQHQPVRTNKRCVQNDDILDTLNQEKRKLEDIKKIRRDNYLNNVLEFQRNLKYNHRAHSSNGCSSCRGR